MNKEKKPASSKVEGLIPELRFPEYKDSREWEKKMIEDVVFAESSNMTLNMLNLKSSGYPIYGADGIVGYTNDFQQIDKYISIVKDGAGVGRLTLCESKSSVLGTLSYLKSRNLKDYDLTWIYYLLNTIDFTAFVKGSGIPHIYYSDYKNKNIAVPNPKEQHKIASCLSSLDETIEAHSQKLNLLKEHKKGLMQNLFPQKGEKVPKLRFKEFEKEGEWEGKKLGEVAEFAKGKGISKSDVVENGILPCIRYGELYTNYKEIITDVFSFTNVPVEDLVLSKANDVIIPSSGETHEDIATASCVMKNGIALGGDLNIIRTKINGVFLSYYLNNVKKKEIAQIAQGISIVHLYSNQLQNLKIVIPSKKEQNKIASFLLSLDKVIKTQTEKIEQLKLHKKGLMQGLFPKVSD